ncbi:hypothetical protein D3C85_1285310 [compost metagenome]
MVKEHGGEILVLAIGDVLGGTGSQLDQGEQALAVAPLQFAKPTSGRRRLAVLFLQQGLMFVVQDASSGLGLEALDDLAGDGRVDVPGRHLHVATIGRLEVTGRGHLQPGGVVSCRRRQREAAGGECDGEMGELSVHAARVRRLTGAIFSAYRNSLGGGNEAFSTKPRAEGSWQWRGAYL